MEGDPGQQDLSLEYIDKEIDQTQSLINFFRLEKSPEPLKEQEDKLLVLQTIRRKIVKQSQDKN